MFNGSYNAQLYSPQVNLDRINEQINQLENLKKQLQQPAVQPQQPTNLTQNFQLAPTNREVIRYANSMDEVSRDMVIGDTPYFSRDMSIVWIKNTKGEIKTYELTEIIPKDEKDMQIEFLMSQVEELKGMIKNEHEYAANVNETGTSKDDGATGATTKESKPTGVSRISKSKTK